MQIEVGLRMWAFKSTHIREEQVDSDIPEEEGGVEEARAKVNASACALYTPNKYRSYLFGVLQVPVKMSRLAKTIDSR